MSEVEQIVDWLERRLINARRTAIAWGDDYHAGRESEVRNILHAVRIGAWKAEEEEK